MKEVFENLTVGRGRGREQARRRALLIIIYHRYQIDCNLCHARDMRVTQIVS